MMKEEKENEKKNERNRYFQYSFHDSFDSMVILKKMSVCVREREREGQRITCR